jgi:ATP-dependent Clp protease ATP-binding subunit ClpC
MLLQIMEEGVLSDARGRKVDFRNAIIIMTSNVGAQEIRRQSGLGFQIEAQSAEDEQREYDDMSRKLKSQLRRLFRPEFLNRVDSIVIFHALDMEAIRQIVELEVDKVRTRLRENGLDLELTDAGRDWLAEEGYNEEYGARPLRRLIQEEVETPLSDALLTGEFTSGDLVIVDADESGLVIRQAEEEPEPVVS